MRRTPKLGQHFLNDTRFIKPMLDAAALSEQDAVIEVGPGKGVLTKVLLKKAGKVLALELDERLAARLDEKLGEHANLEVRKADARRVAWPELVRELKAQGFADVKLVSNLPYYLATQMVIHALAAESVSRIVGMVQDEVARRMCGAPGTKDFSSYSVAVQYYGDPSYVIKVPPKAFLPPPRVSSAIVRIDRRQTPRVSVPDPERFFYLVHAMFTHRRKTVRNCLQGISNVPELPAWEAALAKAGIDPQRRPETLSMDEMAALVRALGTL